MFNGYFKLATAAVHTRLAYRTAFWMRFLDTVIRVYLLTVFWTAIYSGRDSVDGVTLSAMITYSLLATLQENLVEMNVHMAVANKIRQGSVVIDLTRPYGFLRSHLAADVGGLILNGIFVAVIGIFFSLWLPFRLPDSPWIALFYIFSIGLSFSVRFMISSLMALAAFWVLEISGLNMIVNLVSRFLAGGFVPLWLMPPVVQRLSNFLPFQSIVYLPVAIYIGKITNTEVYWALGQQIIWVGVLAIIVNMFWKVTERKIVVQGG
jgi:ABC-2 type transport system permease protein